MASNNPGFQFNSPFARSRERPRLPAELLELSEADYAARLRDYGYSEKAIEQELDTLRSYLARTAPVDPTPAVKPGPIKGTLFDNWAHARQRRRARKERDDGETDER